MQRVTAFRLSVPLLLLSANVLVSGCGVSRSTGPGKAIGYYDYSVLNPHMSYADFHTAQSMLGQSFAVLPDDDPRLELPNVRQKACMVSIDWRRGFWSSSAWAEVKDYGDGTHVLTSSVRGGMLWMGVKGDVSEVIRDVAAARAAGPALPPDARNPAPANGNIGP